jgi:hypothetical protein
VIFRPAVLNHPSYEMSPEHHKLSQEVVEFLIEHQDWFMLDIPPPPRKDSILDSNKPQPSRNLSSISATPTTPAILSGRTSALGKREQGMAKGSPLKNSKGPFTSITNQQKPTEESDDFGMYVGPLSDEDDAGQGGWRLAGTVADGSNVGRRRTFSERGSPRRPMGDEQDLGRKSAENVSIGGISMSAPAGGGGPLSGITMHLAPVRETSGADMDMLVELEEKENNVPDVNMSSPRHHRPGTGSGAEASTSTATTSVLGTGANVSRSSSTKERRTKFDDSKHPRAEEERERERRGRSLIGGGLFGSVKRSRTVEGTALTGTGASSNGDVSRGTLRGHERQVLKKRNSRVDVDKIER